MDYLKVSIVELPNVVYEEHDNGNIRFTDSLGNTIPFVDGVHYTMRDSVTAFEAWMIPNATPPAKTILSKLEFLFRFTTEERVAIRTAAKSNMVLEDFMALLNITEFVDTTYPATVQGVRLFETVGLIAAGRADQILGV